MDAAANKVIAFVLKGYPRLSETFIINEILVLEQMGLKLRIFAMRDPGESKVHDYVRKVQAPVTYIPDYFWRHVAAFLTANVRLWLQRPGIYMQALCYALVNSLRWRNLGVLKRFAQAALLVQRHLQSPAPGSARRQDSAFQIVHLHAHFIHDPTTVAFFASWLTGMSYSISAHAKDIYLETPAFVREKIRRARFVVTCTDYNRRHLQKLAGGSGAIFRSYHGIDITRFTPPELRPAAQPEFVLSVGRFVPKKGFPVLVRALHLLRQRGGTFRCHLIGGGPMENQLRRLVTELELQDCVQLLPQMSQQELLQYYRQAGLFVMACEVQPDGDRDGIPNVIVEAMAMGIPVVATDISGIPECVVPGETGLLVPEKNPEALAHAMLSLWQQPEWARELGQAGRQKVMADFDARRNVERIGTALHHTVTGQPLPRQFFQDGPMGHDHAQPIAGATPLPAGGTAWVP